MSLQIKLVVFTICAFYWLLLGWLLESFSPVELASLELFYPNFRDVRYFYIWPYFLLRFSWVFSFLSLVVGWLLLPLLALIFPSVANLLFIGVDVLVLSVVLSVVTWFVLSRLESYYPQALSMLVICLLFATLASYTVRLSLPVCLIWFVVLVVLEGSQFVFIRVDRNNDFWSDSTTSLIWGNQAIDSNIHMSGKFRNINHRLSRIFSISKISLFVILPFMAVILLRLLLSPFSNYLFVFGLIFSVYIILLPSLTRFSILPTNKQYSGFFSKANPTSRPLLLVHHPSVGFYLWRGWLVRNYAFLLFCLALLSRDPVFLVVFLLSWVLLRILLRSFFYGRE